MKYLKLNYILNFLIIAIIGVYIGKYFYKKPRFVNGEVAKEFTATNIDGTKFSLSDLEGKYVLLDFWGSWCGPCRQENPGLTALYNKYKNEKLGKSDGFEIVGIAVEFDENRWRNAIQKDQLNWSYQILDLTTSTKFFNAPVANIYGVKQLPTKYLVNPDGRIVGVNQSTEEINAFFESL